MKTTFIFLISLSFLTAITVSFVQYVRTDHASYAAVDRLWQISSAEERASAKAYNQKIKALRQILKKTENSTKIINIHSEIQRLKLEKESEFKRIRTAFQQQKAAIYGTTNE